MGKSTVISKVLSALSVSVGGFRTSFDADRAKTDRWLYMWDAAGAPIQDEAHGVVRFTDSKADVLIDRFTDLGCQALRHAQDSSVQLILMDECGRFEGKATALQAEIFSVLDGNIPVLGVVRQGYSGWLDEIRNHPKVTLLTVTPENRDILPDLIVSALRPHIK